MKIISWNLLRLTGATLDHVVALVKREKPAVLLMQEATERIDTIVDHLGGHYERTPLPGRIHGLAIWSMAPMRHKPRILTLPSGVMFHRICQILDLGDFSVANVHLSHGQVLNRRQLHRIGRELPAHAAVIGDYNLMGPAMLPGFRDVGPRLATHMCGRVMPLRLDRCLVRGLVCTGAAALERELSDHRPISMRLSLPSGAERPIGSPPAETARMTPAHP
jgi:endonuclease/exonuclease/phosphatase (EEP) superfamily protein YafD